MPVTKSLGSLFLQVLCGTLCACTPTRCRSLPDPDENIACKLVHALSGASENNYSALLCTILHYVAQTPNPKSAYPTVKPLQGRCAPKRAPSPSGRGQRSSPPSSLLCTAVE